MQRKLLVATVAAGPILALAFAAPAARAQNPTLTISTATTAPVSTATAVNGGPGDIVVDTSGSITLSAPGNIITLNSNNNITVNDPITARDLENSTGILVQGGNTGNVILNGTDVVASSYQPTDTDGDGDLDGPYTQGANRFGIRVVGPGTFTGNITMQAASALLVTGADSAGISIEAPMVGNLTTTSSNAVTGDRVYGVHVTAPLTGVVRIQGTTTATGLAATGVALDGDVNGQTIIQGSVTATGFRYTTRATLASDRAKLDADDLLTGGPGVRIGGNMSGGVIFDIAPTVTQDTVDANGDGIFDYLQVDSDNDGITDAAEGTSLIDVYGSAPGVLVGSTTQAITLGPVTGYNYGLVNRGTVTADGVFDGYAATAIQIGTSAGLGVNITNGFYNSGGVAANSYEADATGLRVLAGSNIPLILNSGSISASAATEGTGAFTARAIAIAQGANVPAINNSGAITATSSGPTMSATAIEDLSGTLTRIDNSGSIGGTVTNTTTTPTTGRGIAIDARANTAGLTVVQTGTISNDGGVDTDGDGVDDSKEPFIRGDVLFGSGNDTLQLTNGTLSGAMSFGAGADTLSISGGAIAVGAVTDSDGRLAINLDKGGLSISNAETIRATSLHVTSADSQLVFAIDPAANTNTRISVGTANIANNAQLGVSLKSVLDSSQRYTVIDAGSLTAGAIRSSLLGAPYLYLSTATADTAAGKVYIDVRPRTAAELGFNSTEAGAYSAVLQALKNDEALAQPLLTQSDRAGLVHQYDQFLPDLGHGTFDALSYANEQVAMGIAARPDPYERYGPDSVWGQEINSLIRTETDKTMGSDTQVFGFAGGYEAMGEYGGALGVAVTYLNVQERDNDAQVGERTDSNLLQADVYWRRNVGGLTFTVGGGGGYVWLNGHRSYFSGDLNGDGVNDVERDNSANWNGFTGHAFSSVSYQADFGHFFVRPDGRLDYAYLHEGERKESGGGSGFDLLTRARSSSALNASAGMTFGATFGHDFWWRPEIRVGYRQQVAGSYGDTVAQFTGGTPFTLASANNKDGAITLDMALRAGTPMSYLALEGGVAAAKKQKRYNVRLAGRMMF